MGEGDRLSKKNQKKRLREGTTASEILRQILREHL